MTLAYVLLAALAAVLLSPMVIAPVDAYRGRRVQRRAKAVQESAEYTLTQSALAWKSRPSGIRPSVVWRAALGGYLWWRGMSACRRLEVASPVAGSEPGAGRFRRPLPDLAARAIVLIVLQIICVMLVVGYVTSAIVAGADVIIRMTPAYLWF